jgi:uracil-DNA glycosylase family 4
VTSGTGESISAAERRELLKEVFEQARGCIACQLHQTRTQVVFGAGNADADVMFIGEAPGADEDRLGLPFVGRAGKLLDRLLGEIGLERGDVFIANTLKCRPPGNRDPYPNEIESCSGYLRRQVELIEPKVICTLGNFSTKLLREDSTGISRLHGRDEVRTIGTRAVRLLPLYHPAAALYTPSNLQTLQDDFARIPELLALDAPPQPRTASDAPDRGDPGPPEPEPEPEDAGPPELDPDDPALTGFAAEDVGPMPSDREPTEPTEPAAGVREREPAILRPGEPPEPTQLGLF